MNKEITIIELFNKIANNEKMPKKIKYDNEIFYFNEKDIEYYSNEDYENMLQDHLCLDELNEKAIILDEENDEFEDIEEMNLIQVGDVIDYACEFNIIKSTINQIIRNQKKLIERLNKDE